MPRYRFGDCELDTATRCLTRSGVAVAVEPKVLDLLEYLLRHRERFLSHAELLDSLWPSVVVAPAALARAVKEARRAVGDDGTRQAIIATLHGRGYRLVAEVHEQQPSAAQASDRDARQPADTRAAFETTRPAASSTLEASNLHDSRLGIAWLSPHPAPPRAFRAQGTLVFGRSDECDVALRCKDASRRHAVVYRDGPIDVLRDLGSMNGTFLNAERVSQAPLREGDLVRLGDALGRVVPLDQGRTEAAQLAEGVIGSGALDRARQALADALTAGAAPCTVVGETGSGKLTLARAVAAQTKPGRPCVALFSDELADGGELSLALGSAARRAEDGVLVLPRVTELSRAAQVELARALDSTLGALRRKGARLVLTSQEPLDEALAEGRLERELSERLHGTAVLVPPLRARSEDIPALFSHHVRAANGGRELPASARLLEKLCLYDWPYNVRELVVLVREMLLAHAHQPSLRSRHLPAWFRLQRAALGAATERDVQAPASSSSSPSSRLREALRAHRGDVGRAAAALGTTPERAYALMRADEGGVT